MAPDDPRNARPSRPELELAGDAQLVIRVATGEEAALAELYRRHGSGVYGLALRLLGRSDLADEVVQEMVALWEPPTATTPTAATCGRSCCASPTARPSTGSVRRPPGAAGRTATNGATSATTPTWSAR